MENDNTKQRAVEATPPCPAVEGSYYALTRGRGIPYNEGGGNEEVPWKLGSTTYDAASTEAERRYGDSLIRVYLEARK
jgi:hypothetical protein